MSQSDRDRAWTWICILVAFLGAAGGFSLAMLLVGSSNYGDFWIKVANLGG